MRKSAILVAAAGIAAAAVAAVPDAEARPWGWGGYRGGWYGGYARPWGWGGYYRRGWGWGGGAVAAGFAAGAIGGLIANSFASPAYAYGYPAYAYGYYPYEYGYPVRTVSYVDPAPVVVVRRRVVYRAPGYRTRTTVRRAYRYGPRHAIYRPRAHFYRQCITGRGSSTGRTLLPAGYSFATVAPGRIEVREGRALSRPSR